MRVGVGAGADVCDLWQATAIITHAINAKGRYFITGLV